MKSEKIPLDVRSYRERRERRGLTPHDVADALVGFGVARRRYQRKRKRPEILVQAISGYAFNPGPVVAEILKEATRE